MRLTLLAAAVVALTVTACGKPNQALPEQQKENFSKITGQQSPASGAPATAPAAAAPEASVPPSGESSGTTTEGAK